MATHAGPFATVAEAVEELTAWIKQQDEVVERFTSGESFEQIVGEAPKILATLAACWFPLFRRRRHGCDRRCGQQTPEERRDENP
jgi:hypothetical protein